MRRLDEIARLIEEAEADGRETVTLLTEEAILLLDHAFGMESNDEEEEGLGGDCDHCNGLGCVFCE